MSGQKVQSGMGKGRGKTAELLEQEGLLRPKKRGPGSRAGSVVENTDYQQDEQIPPLPAEFDIDFLDDTIPVNLPPVMEIDPPVQPNVAAAPAGGAQRRRGGGGGAARGARNRQNIYQRIPADQVQTFQGNVAQRIAQGAANAAAAVVNARRAGRKLKLSEACKEYSGGNDWSSVKRGLQAQRDVAKLQYQCLKAELRKMGIGKNTLTPEKRYIKLVKKGLSANSQANQLAADEGFGQAKKDELTGKARTQLNDARAAAARRRGH